jgi:hypothetical protein
MNISFTAIVTCFIEHASGLVTGKGNSERAAFVDALTQLPPDDWQETLKEYQEYLKKEGKNEGN